jgi:hypothetical protein
MKKFSFFILMIAIVIPVFAQNATVERISGKVEYLAAGGRWTPVAVGDVIPIGATISTGFRSSAVLLVAGSEISVMALTRMSIEDLAETSDTVTTSLNLRTGKVRASVRSTAGKSTNFTLRSPVSTAAVRGTEFFFDDYRVQVIDGIVEFLSWLNISRWVPAGNWSEITLDGSPSKLLDGQKRLTTIRTDITGAPDITKIKVPKRKGNLVITIDR